MIFLALLLFFLSTKTALAQINICKFSASTPDWVQVCNSSDQNQDLSLYTIQDSSANNLKTLDCFLSANSSYSISLGNWLNNAGDYILLKDGSTTIDCVSYGDKNCPDSDIHTPDSTPEKSCLVFSGTWQITDDCSSAEDQSCITSTPTSTSTPSPTPISPTPSPTTAISEPTPTHTPTPVPDFSLSINSSPDSADQGSSFDISYSVQNAQPNADYYLKAYETSSTSKAIELKNSDNWQACYENTNWDSLPIIDTDSNGNVDNYTLSLRAKSDKDGGEYQIKIKIKKTDDDNNTAENSFTININQSSAPDPTATNTPTPTIKITPTKTNSPTPSPSKKPSPTPMGIATEPESTDSEILGIQDIKITPTPKTKGKKQSISNLLPKILITTGTLLLLSPIIIAKIKK